MTNSDPCPPDSSEYDGLDDGWDPGEVDPVATHRLALLRTYFARFGLQGTSAAAARCVLTAVLREPSLGRDDAAIERRLIAVARTWLRDFSEADGVPSAAGTWLSRAPVLLSKFPGAFLATPVPDHGALR